MAERSEFELPVPVSKLPDDSIMLSFAIHERDWQSHISGEDA
jgi:hypothetical protein